MNSQGINPVMDSMLQEINNLYLTFLNRNLAKEHHSNSDLILSSMFWNIVQNSYDIFKTMNMVYLIYLDQDIKASYKTIKMIEIIMSLLSIVLNFGFFLGCIILSSKKIREYILLLNHSCKNIYYVISGT